jgi:hypothetical protein
MSVLRYVRRRNNAPNVLLATYGSTAMQIMFLDESGDHSLKKIDPQFPIFALAGCIFEQEYHQREAGEAGEAVKQYKRRLFGTEAIVLHTSDIARNRNGFERLVVGTFRQQFYQETNALVASLDFTVVAVALRKDAHVARHGRNAADPYHFCLTHVIERYYDVLCHTDQQGLVVAESRGSLFDTDLFRAFNQLLHSGIGQIGGVELRGRILGLSFRPKADNVVGLQIADLVATPIARHTLGKQDDELRNHQAKVHSAPR